MREKKEESRLSINTQQWGGRAGERENIQAGKKVEGKKKKDDFYLFSRPANNELTITSDRHHIVKTQ